MNWVDSNQSRQKLRKIKTQTTFDFKRQEIFRFKKITFQTKRPCLVSTSKNLQLMEKSI